MAKKKTQAQKKLHLEILKQMITLATSGFGLVAALAWNNVIQEFVKVYINRFLPTGSSVVSLLLYAVIVTIIAVLVTYQLTKIAELSERRSK